MIEKHLDYLGNSLSFIELINISFISGDEIEVVLTASTDDTLLYVFTGLNNGFNGFRI